MRIVGGTLSWLIALCTSVRAAPVVAGWTADGKAVVLDVGAGAEACTPVAFDADGDLPKASCVPCGADARACGVVGGKPRPSSTSPDRTLAIKRTVSCWITGHDADVEMCTQAARVGWLGSVRHTDEVTDGGKRARLTTVFRPDGGAVAIVFAGGSGEDEVAIVDLADHLARAHVAEKVTELLARQARVLAGTSTEPVYTADATFFTDDAGRGALAADALAKLIAGPVTFARPEIGTSTDGHAAWASFVATTADRRAFRVTELVVRDGAAWRVASGAWTIGLADQDAAARARAGSLPAPTEVARRRQDVPDELSVLGAMLRDGDPEVLRSFTKRARAMVVGTAPGERLVGGARLAPAWKPWLTSGMRGAKVRGALSPRGTSGWLVANVVVTRDKPAPRYELPVRVWAVVDRSERGALEFVLLHAAVTR